MSQSGCTDDATADAIDATVAELAALGVQSATTGDQSVTAIDVLKLDELARRKRADAVTCGSSGRVRSGWRGIVTGRAVMGGPTD